MSMCHRQETRPAECEHCGTAICSDDWYPVRTERDSAGRLRVCYFCSEPCAGEWAGDD